MALRIHPVTSRSRLGLGDDDARMRGLPSDDTIERMLEISDPGAYVQKAGATSPVD